MGNILLQYPKLISRYQGLIFTVDKVSNESNDVK